MGVVVGELVGVSELVEDVDSVEVRVGVSVLVLVREPVRVGVALGVELDVEVWVGVRVALLVVRRALPTKHLPP